MSVIERVDTERGSAEPGCHLEAISELERVQNPTLAGFLQHSVCNNLVPQPCVISCGP